MASHTLRSILKEVVHPDRAKSLAQTLGTELREKVHEEVTTCMKMVQSEFINATVLQFNIMRSEIYAEMTASLMYFFCRSLICLILLCGIILVFSKVMPTELYLQVRNVMKNFVIFVMLGVVFTLLMMVVY